MKLLDSVLSDYNLDKAIKQVVKNKGTNGVDKMATQDLRNIMSTEFRETLKSEIRNRKYKPKPVRRVEIPKSDGGVRLLGIPTVIDRMIQQAIHQILSPIYEPLFSEFSYGFRPLRSAHMAIEQSLDYMNQSRDWIVDIDLEKFFDLVHHDKLIQIVSETIRDGEIGRAHV